MIDELNGKSVHWENLPRPIGFLVNARQRNNHCDAITLSRPTWSACAYSFAPGACLPMSKRKGKRNQLPLGCGCYTSCQVRAAGALDVVGAADLGHLGSKRSEHGGSLPLAEVLHSIRSGYGEDRGGCQEDLGEMWDEYGEDAGWMPSSWLVVVQTR